MAKQYEASRMEKAMQLFWQEHQIYRFEPESTKEIFSIDTPPPTVSGQLHIGHIFSYAQAEMIARFKRMQGYNVFYPFGFDDNGLPTERLVEKEKQIKGKDLPPSAFTALCQEVAGKYEADFQELWQSLGFSVDWELQYETSSEETTRISQKLFLELAHKGKAYMKESPVLWCTQCQTSIAQAELETQEKATTFNTIPFEVEGEIIQVATTRPELLGGCVALFVNGADERYKQYIGKQAKVPLYGYEIPILADEAVSQEKGTGAVMCATFGDSIDVKWYETYNLPYREMITPDGRMQADLPWIGGLRIEKARKRIIEILSEQGLLLAQEQMMHTIATHERCGEAVEILPSKQWYIDILTDRAKYLEAGEQIQWYPAGMKNRYRAWVENLKWDWCISRQRYFGVPIPVWYCEDCGKIRWAKAEELPINPLESQPQEPCSCGCQTFIPETSVLDTWATSSITPQINARWQEEGDRSKLILPMSLRTQAHEIIRTWAFYTIVRSLYHTGEIPWQEIMISGFVLAQKGEKISKSKNNGKLSPKELIATHSADTLRYWAAHTKLGSDTFFAETDLKDAKRFLNKLWHASQFASMHLQDIDEDLLSGKTLAQLLPADQWILERTHQTMREATRLLNSYEIGLAKHAIDELFWKDFCDDYLELVKDRLYKPEIHGEQGRRSAQYALYQTLLQLLKMYAIYIPHLTETIYQECFRQHEKTLSLHQLTWEAKAEENAQLLALGEHLKACLMTVRKYKSERNLSMKAEMEYLEIRIPEALKEGMLAELGDLKACCHLHEIQLIIE